MQNAGDGKPESLRDSTAQYLERPGKSLNT
jgi:hypothetical protein